jgi:hypothetical protein
MTHDIARLECEVRALDEAICNLQAAKHVERLIPIIRKPGWTTPAELELVQSNISNLHYQTRHLHNTFDTLIEIAGKIGQDLRPMVFCGCGTAADFNAVVAYRARS